MFRVAFLEPKIASNTGNAIRLTAVAGCELHLIGPLGYDLSDAKLRRAGLDYHDLACVRVHDNAATAWTTYAACADPPRIFAFTGRGETNYADVRYQPGDVLLFGSEPTGLPAEVLADDRITERVSIPMLAARRSLNLSNCAALVVYEAWRQNDFGGSAGQDLAMGSNLSE